MDAVHSSVPSSPVLSHKQIHLAHKSTSDSESMQRNLDELREQLQAAKIPVTKRASIAELPQSADDCQLVPGTTRCSLSLCEDSCTQRHQHHRTHAKPLAVGAPLIYARPSISMAQGLSSYVASPADSSPAGSMPPSTNTSPQQQYRRASAFGFNFAGSSGGNAAHHRGSIMSSGFFPTGPAEDFTSGPPSPFSAEEESSALSSAANSPRDKTTTTTAVASFPAVAAPSASSAFVPTLPDFSQPIREESKLLDDASVPAASAASGSSTVPAAAVAAYAASASAAASLDTDYWRLRNHIVRLSDYAPGSLSLGTEESRARTDLAAAPRDDFPDQEDCSWDPRSPQPPSPVEMRTAQVLQVNMNQQDRTKPEIEFVIKPQL